MRASTIQTLTTTASSMADNIAAGNTAADNSNTAGNTAADNRAAGSNTGTVSYTHLDVYKRQ